MNLCFFGPSTDRQVILDLLNEVPEYSHLRDSVSYFEDYDSFVENLPQKHYDCAVITENNANGMEGVIALRNVLPQLPLIWFSNDEGFGCQAYRLNADFFHTKPITAEILKMALRRTLPK